MKWPEDEEDALEPHPDPPRWSEQVAAMNSILTAPEVYRKVHAAFAEANNAIEAFTMQWLLEIVANEEDARSFITAERTTHEELNAIRAACMAREAFWFDVAGVGGKQLPAGRQSTSVGHGAPGDIRRGLQRRRGSLSAL